MLVVGLSLAAAALLAGTALFTVRGLAGGSVAQSVFITFAVSTALVVVAALAGAPPEPISLEATVAFVGDGALGFLAVFLLFNGVRAVGPTTSYVLKNAAPLITLLFAVLLLGERPAPLVYAGALLATAGIIALTTGGGPVSFRPGLLWPAGAAVAFALDNVVRRAALQQVASPLAGLALALPISLLCAALWAARAGPLLPASRSATRGFAVAGVCQGLALVCLYSALRIGSVSVVTPLYTSSPAFVLLFSRLCLGKAEPVTRRTVLAVLVAVAGVAIVAVASG